jgi:hypothetical protein
VKKLVRRWLARLDLPQTRNETAYVDQRIIGRANEVCLAAKAGLHEESHG